MSVVNCNEHFPTTTQLNQPFVGFIVATTANVAAYDDRRLYGNKKVVKRKIYSTLFRSMDLCPMLSLLPPLLLPLPPFTFQVLRLIFSGAAGSSLCCCRPFARIILTNQTNYCDIDSGYV